MNSSIRVVLVGGGHCNVQVLKQLKRIMPKSGKLTIVTDDPVAFYSEMLPGAVSNLYSNNDLIIHLEPLAIWSHAEYIKNKVIKIIGNENIIELEDGSIVEYDLLVINIGSRTKGTFDIEGVWDHSITTRPIN